MVSIYIAIPSYMDKDLPNTIKSIMKNTKSLNSIFICIFSQDLEHSDLETVFDEYNFSNYKYDKIDYRKAKGVGYARKQCQKYLNNKYDYYLQVDSHTRFIKDWDEIIVNDYIKSESVWGDIIYSTYPHGFLIKEDGSDEIPNLSKSQALKILKIDKEERLLPFEAKYYDRYIGDEYGFWSGFFCGGFAFGRSKHFLKVPYDPNIAFWGEEHLMSIRFYDKDIKIICPERNYLFHDYDGHRRKGIWDTNEKWEKISNTANQKISDFLEGKNKDKYHYQDEEKFRIWKICFIQDE